MCLNHYQNRRKDFVQTFLDHLANWDFDDKHWTIR